MWVFFVFFNGILRHITIWQQFAGQSIIQISGSRWIDGEDALFPAGEALLSDQWMHTDKHHEGVAVPPQISPGAQFLRRDGPGQVLGQALQHLTGEVGKIDVVLHEDALRLRLDLSGLAQRLSQSPGGGQQSRRLVGVTLSFPTYLCLYSDSHPSAKLLFAGQSVIRHINKVLL